MLRVWGTLRVALAAAIIAGAGVTGTAHATPTGAHSPHQHPSHQPVWDCTPHLLVLSAFPAELDALIVHATLDRRHTYVVGDRTFYTGTLAGHPVVMALTGIGPANANATTALALDTFGCGAQHAISGVVFSGVAGTTGNIGDVMIPDHWTSDPTGPGVPVDPTMFATATTVAAGGTVPLEQDAPVGNPACVCADVPSVAFTHMPNAPRIVTGGTGLTTDPVAGRKLPCVPGGGDVFGCKPCHAPSVSPPDAVGLVQAVIPFLDPSFFFMSAPPAETSFIAEDEESAAVGEQATTRGVPFIVFRGASDGHGDPLMLPGFPVSFVAYRQIAADNAAAMTLAFLAAW